MHGGGGPPGSGQHAGEMVTRAQGARRPSVAGVGLRFGDLSTSPTHTTVDWFEVDLAKLNATAAFEVIAASDRTVLGTRESGRGSTADYRDVSPSHTAVWLSRFRIESS